MGLDISHLLTQKSNIAWDCFICFKPMEDGLFITKCCHVFHAACFSERFSKKTICPSCSEKAPLNEAIANPVVEGITLFTSFRVLNPEDIKYLLYISCLDNNRLSKIIDEVIKTQNIALLAFTQIMLKQWIKLTSDSGMSDQLDIYNQNLTMIHSSLIPMFKDCLAKSDLNHANLMLKCAEVELMLSLIELTFDPSNYSFEFRKNSPHKKIFECAKDEDLDISSFNVTALDKFQRTPLHIACLKGNIKIARKLRENGADIHAIDCFGRTPLHYIAIYKNWELLYVDQIFDSSVLNQQDKFFLSPILIAAIKQDSVGVKQLGQLIKSKEINLWGTPHNLTAMHIALLKENIETFSVVCEMGASAIISGLFMPSPYKILNENPEKYPQEIQMLGYWGIPSINQLPQPTEEFSRLIVEGQKLRELHLSEAEQN